jgi:hypothetical protein
MVIFLLKNLLSRITIKKKKSYIVLYIFERCIYLFNLKVL